MRKTLAAAILCLGLQACSMVGAEKPLFAAADAAGAPPLRPGLWAMPETGCQGFDPAQPADKWPGCANMIIVRTGTVGGDEHEDDGSIKKRELAYVLAAGDPRILQLAAPDDRKPDEPPYLFLGVKPSKTDPEGRIIEGRLWLVLCEPIPTNDKMFAKHKPHPLPGLRPMKDGEGCLADAQGPVRAAAAASEGWLRKADLEDAIITAHWVRDGEK
jgi:hypothetical protein